MPEDSRKNQDKKKNDPKEQRKPRNTRNHANKAEKKADKAEESKSTLKVTVPQKPPVYQDPGPEFYKNLKRETEETLKITEEESSKYKKKEIQSNWSKYEIPIESYEDVEEQDIGADYEKLIQMPLSIGGHFQFKHEKSWDMNTGPSPYDKYFEINMDNLSLAVSTVAFYERNEVDTLLFSEADMLTMNNRATKYKQKYFEDKSYSTSETEAHDKILNTLTNSLRKNQVDTDTVDEEIQNESVDSKNTEIKDDIDLDFKNLSKTDYVPSPVHSSKEIKLEVEQQNDTSTSIDDIDELLVEDKSNTKQVEESSENVVDLPKSVTLTECIKKPNESEDIKIATAPITETNPQDKPADPKSPVIESPEDLEKWLDDFLDG